MAYKRTNSQNSTYRRQTPGGRGASGRAGRKPRYRLTKAGVAVVLAAVLLLVLGISGLIALLGRGGAGFDPIAQMAEGPPYAVALDAGHGGKDIGAEGLIREVDMNETTVGYLYEMLDGDPNYKPILCREAGQSATQEERLRAASKGKALLLLSVHGNADPTYDTTVGFECFPAPPGRTYHDNSMQFAQLLAGEMAAAGHALRGEGGVRYVYYEASSSIGGGEEGEYDKVFREASDATVYPEASFGMVDKPNCPAVLAEQCFITSVADVAAFGTDEGCRRAAACYYRAICAYFGTAPQAV